MSPGSSIDVQTPSSPSTIKGGEFLSSEQQARLNQYTSQLSNPGERQNQIAKLELILKNLIADFGDDKKLIQEEFNSSLKECEVYIEKGQIRAEKGQVTAEKGQVTAEKGQKQEVVGQVTAEKGQKQEVVGQVTAEKGQVSAEKGQVTAEKGQKQEVVGQSGESAVNKNKAAIESLILAGKVLESRITSLTGIVPSKLASYDTALAIARADLASQGRDARLAEGLVLLQFQEAIMSKAPAGSRTELRASFASLREGLGAQGLPTYTAAEKALSDPRVSLEDYNKIRLGFGSHPPLVYSSNGEYRTSRELVTGNTTVMNIRGERFRESRGISIASPVPNTGAIEETQARLTNAQATYRIREPQVSTMARITLSEIRDLGTRDIRADGATGEVQTSRLNALSRATEELRIDPSDPEGASKLRLGLTRFFTSDTFKSLPDADKRQISDCLRIYHESIQNQANLQREIKALEKSNPAALIQSQIAKQDAIIDRNLADINHIGLHHLGQNGYKQILSAVSSAFKQRALGEVIDFQPLTDSATSALKSTLLGLIGQTQAQAYPDGTLSTQAIAKIQGLRGVSQDQINTAAEKAIPKK
jgi:hypothetical protein